VHKTEKMLVTASKKLVEVLVKITDKNYIQKYDRNTKVTIWPCLHKAVADAKWFRVVLHRPPLRWIHICLGLMSLWLIWQQQHRMVV